MLSTIDSAQIPSLSNPYNNIRTSSEEFSRHAKHYSDSPVDKIITGVTSTVGGVAGGIWGGPVGAIAGTAIGSAVGGVIDIVA